MSTQSPAIQSAAHTHDHSSGKPSAARAGSAGGASFVQDLLLLLSAVDDNPMSGSMDTGDLGSNHDMPAGAQDDKQALSGSPAAELLGAGTVGLATAFDPGRTGHPDGVVPGSDSAKGMLSGQGSGDVISALTVAREGTPHADRNIGESVVALEKDLEPAGAIEGSGEMPPLDLRMAPEAGQARRVDTAVGRSSLSASPKGQGETVAAEAQAGAVARSPGSAKAAVSAIDQGPSARDMRLGAAGVSGLRSTVELDASFARASDSADAGESGSGDHAFSGSNGSDRTALAQGIGVAADRFDFEARAEAHDTATPDSGTSSDSSSPNVGSPGFEDDGSAQGLSLRRATVHLDGPWGGDMRIGVELTGNEANVSFQASRADDASALANSLDVLRERLELEGLALGQVDIGGGGGSPTQREMPQSATDLAGERSRPLPDQPLVQARATENTSEGHATPGARRALGRLDLYA